MIEKFVIGTISNSNRPILIYYNLASDNRSQYEVLGNKYRVCGVYSPEPRCEVYCLRLNFNISKLVYWTEWSTIQGVIARVISKSITP